MISMMKTRFGASACPAVRYVGSGAKAASGVAGGLRPTQWRLSGHQSALVVRMINPTLIFDNAISVSAARERSP